jgi:hypothetical protein
VGRIYEQVKQRPLYFVQETTSKSDSILKGGDVDVLVSR